MNFQIRTIDSSDRRWIESYLAAAWHSEFVIRKGEKLYPAQLDGFLAVEDTDPLGLLTYQIKETECEVVTINSLRKRIGVGTHLMNAVHQQAKNLQCHRLWLITTNDNLTALQFYQKWGLRMTALYPGALEHARKIKPSIPLAGLNGIPLRDEIELSIEL